MYYFLYMNIFNKKILITIFFLILIIIVVIIYFSGEWLKIYEFACDQTSNEKKQGVCFFNLAKIENNNEICEKIKDYSTGRDCYYYFAIKDKNIELCDKTEEKEQSCYEKILEEVTSEETCNRIGRSYRNNCYYRLAVKEKRIDFCFKADDALKNCCDEILKDSSIEKEYCDNIENTNNREYCYYRLAVVRKDTSFCDRTGLKKEACCYEITEDNCLPDLTVEKVEFISLENYPGGSGYYLNIKAYVKNTGIVDTSRGCNVNFLIPEERARVRDFYIGSGGLGRSEIKKGELIIQEIRIPIYKTDPLPIKIEVDVTNVIKEEDESNNFWEGTINIKK